MFELESNYPNLSLSFMGHHLKKDCFQSKNKNKGKDKDKDTKVDNSKAIVPREPKIEELNFVWEQDEGDDKVVGREGSERAHIRRVELVGMKESVHTTTHNVYYPQLQKNKNT